MYDNNNIKEEGIKGSYIEKGNENMMENMYMHCFLGSSAGKESTCKAGDPCLIPRWGSSSGEGIGYPLQYSWASLVAQMVKNQPAVQETWVWSLSWEDSLEEGMATHSSILGWRIAMDRGAGYSPWGCKESDTTERLSTAHVQTHMDKYTHTDIYIVHSWYLNDRI